MWENQHYLGKFNKLLNSGMLASARITPCYGSRALALLSGERVDGAVDSEKAIHIRGRIIEEQLEYWNDYAKRKQFGRMSRAHADILENMARRSHERSQDSASRGQKEDAETWSELRTFYNTLAREARAELQRSEVVASNLGNMHRTGNADNLPYRRKVLVFEEALQAAQGRAGAAGGANGVQVGRVVEDTSTFPTFYQPGHPDADEDGQVMGSNVDLFKELVDMNVIQRSFDANLTALRTYRGMLENTLQQLGR